MNIQEQIEALTKELRPVPGVSNTFWTFDGRFIQERHRYNGGGSDVEEQNWKYALFASTNKAEVEEYADCYRRLKLYQLLGKKKEKEFPIEWSNLSHSYIGTDFTQSTKGDVYSTALASVSQRYCVLGGVWFSREEDRLEALKICGIDKSFQEKCAKYGFGG